MTYLLWLRKKRNLRKRLHEFELRLLRRFNNELPVGKESVAWLNKNLRRLRKVKIPTRPEL